MPSFSIAQKNTYWEEWNKEQIDSLRLIWQNTTNDTLRMAAARSLGMYYQESNFDTGLYFNEQQATLAKKLKLRLWEGDALDAIGYELSQLKKYPRSLEYFLEGINILEDKETEKNTWQISKFSKESDPRVARLHLLGWIHNDIAMLYRGTGNTQDELSHFYQAIKIGEVINSYDLLSTANLNLGNSYVNMNKLDSALSSADKAIHYADISGFQRYKGSMLTLLGDIYFKKGNYVLAKQYFAEAVRVGYDPSNLVNFAYSLLNMSKVFSVIGEKDSCLWYTKKAIAIFQSGNAAEGLDNAYISLSSIYKLQNNVDSAFYYQSLAIAIADSINSVEKIKQFQNIGFDQQLKVQELEKEKIENQNKIRTYSLLAGLAVLSIIAFIIYRNNRQKQKANTVLERTLSNLKSTQAQLIQSEKMASLGELTAGIAHEIQNPLNFVNNFSEVNTELIQEAGQEIDKGNISEAKTILKDIQENEQKINHHGKRADAIVKGMLQHSQTSTGQKEPTDINKLAEEYLRLAYQGLLAKDKLFNATLKTDLDESIGNINIVPQDIGRLLLNLYNNAFYSVDEKNKQQTEGYEPTVSVSSKKVNSHVEVRVRDNGNGIPQKIVDKIFQPFFTTKPTGQGTGLGLSLAYDIVKAHGGELRVQTKEGEGSELIIQLPTT